MNNIRLLLSHATMILSLMFLVFVVLDQFNPMMNFVNNSISTVLLVLWSVLCVTQSLLYWRGTEKGEGA